MYFIKIGENPSIEALPMLVKTAEKTSDAYVGEALARTLGHYKQPEAGGALLHLLSFATRLDPYRKVRSMALYGFELRACPDPHEVEEISARLGETTLNGWAACALAAIGTEQAITMLITALEKQSRDLMKGSVERIEIVKALAKTHNPAALAPLVELLAHAPEWEIKDIAKALKIITGQSFGTDVTKWKAWIAR
jgi:HEAT repeat protein